MLVCILKEQCCKQELHRAGNFEFEPVIRNFSEGQMNMNGL